MSKQKKSGQNEEQAKRKANKNGGWKISETLPPVKLFSVVNILKHMNFFAICEPWGDVKDRPESLSTNPAIILFKNNISLFEHPSDSHTEMMRIFSDVASISCSQIHCFAGCSVYIMKLNLPVANDRGQKQFFEMVIKLFR